MTGRAPASPERAVSTQARFDRFDADWSSASRWTGHWVEPELPVAELVASWNVDLPRGAALDVEAQLRRGATTSKWYSLGRWAPGDAEHGGTSVAGQRDDDADVVVDTLVARGSPASGYRLRLTVDGRAEHVPAPGLVGAMVSAASDGVTGRTVSSFGAPVELAVPSLSQQVHRGRHLELDGGGASWCSPTSVAMVLSYWGAGPDEADLAEIDPAFPDPIVVHAARGVFDPAYGGAGNWSFNVAYAGAFGLEAFVTRLGSLRAAEKLLLAGIPTILSIASGPDELAGFPVPAGTTGHLLVLRGITGAGDAIVNDPAAATSADVRRVYRRGELERAWLGGSNGIAYVIHPRHVPLPTGVAW